MSGFGAITRNLGSSAPTFDAPFGSIPARLGPSAIASMDPLLGFTKGTGISYPGGLDSLFKPTSVSKMGQESDIEEAANATVTTTVSYKVDDSTSHRVDEVSGEGQIMFTVDKAALRYLSDPDDTRSPHDFFADEKDMTSNPHHELTKTIGWSSLNYYLRSEEGRRVFGSQTNTRVMQKVFRLIGAQVTQMLPEQRVRNEQSNTMVPKMVWRIPNYWLAQTGQLPAVGNEVYALPTRYGWAGLRSLKEAGEAKTTKGSYTRGLEWESRREDTKLFEAMKSKKPDAAGKYRALEDSRVLGLGKRGELERDADLEEYFDELRAAKRNVKAYDANPDKEKKQFYWQYNPFHRPSQHRPRRTIHCGLSWTSKAEYIGKVLDHYEGDASALAPTAFQLKGTARKAVFPEEEGDDYKTHLHNLPRIELNFRANPGNFFTG